MLEHADDLTRSLVARLADGTGLPVVALSAGQGGDIDRIEVRLVAVRPRGTPRSWDRADHLQLDYLVTVRRGDALAEHRAVADLAFALLGDPGFAIVDDADVPGCCARLGMALAPGMVVRASLVRVQPAEEAPLVRFPLRARMGAIGSVQGRVLGPAETPIAGALVNLVGFDPVTRTGADGGFRLSAPADPESALRVRVRARGLEAEMPVAPGEPTIVTLRMES